MNDVVVIGGGVAGCAAALAAATAGARVTLLETRGHLGGVAAQGEHRTICGLAAIDAATPALLHADLQAWVDGLATGAPWRQGRVWLWPTSAERIQHTCAQHLVTARVNVCLASPVQALACRDDRIVAIHTATATHPCTAWIDASGGSAIATLLGAPVRPPLAWGAWRGVVQADIAAGLAARTRALAAVADATGLPAACALTPLTEGRWQLSLDVPATLSAVEVDALAQRAAQALGGTLLVGACSVAARDSGGWAGMLGAADCFATTTAGWCWAAWPVEAHHSDGVQWQWPPRDRYGIPHIATQPSRAGANGAVIGRGMPVGANAIAALRVIGTQLALGTAVGRAFA